MCHGNEGWPSSSSPCVCALIRHSRSECRPPAHYMIKTPFLKIISWSYAQTDPCTEKRVTHYLAACRPAGWVIRGYGQQQVVGGYLPRCGLLRAYDHVSDSSNKSNASTSKICFHSLEM